MTKAVNPFGPDATNHPETSEPIEVHAGGPNWEKRRERAVWYAVAGIGMMFAGSISTAIGVGGALMVIFGTVEYIRWTLLRPKADDPWRDPEIDDWESRYHAGEVDAPDVIDEEPEEALGLHDRF